LDTSLSFLILNQRDPVDMVVLQEKARPLNLPSKPSLLLGYTALVFYEFAPYQPLPSGHGAVRSKMA